MKDLKSMIKDLSSFTRKGERKNIEFKVGLSKAYHLKEERKQRLLSQMKYRMEKGKGEAIYFLGVEDDGKLTGLKQDQLDESIFVLENIAHSIDADISVDLYPVKNKKVAQVRIRKRDGQKKEHLLVGVAGHVDHGKSTLLGTLTSGQLDDGSGKSRIFLDVQKHEIERGLSADLSFALYGFCNNNVYHLQNPLDKKEKSYLIEKCDRLVSFVDTVGHEPWLRTTIRGIVGQKLNYGLLTIAADKGPTHITREHLGIILAMDLPVIVVITKIDLVSDSDLDEIYEKIVYLLKLVGRIPFKLKNKKEAFSIAKKMNKHLVPVINVSSVTGENLDILDHLLANIDIPLNIEDQKKPFMIYIDKVYAVKGVGTVVSGTIRHGQIKKGDKLLLGPNPYGEFMEVTAKSIEMHHYKIGSAETGDVVGISVTGADIDQISRGMILCHLEYQPNSYREFEAEIAILVHPTTIKNGYESVTHIETIAETTQLEPLDKKYMSAGDKGRVRMRFKYRPYHIKEGQKIIIREGRSKGIGTITKT